MDKKDLFAFFLNVFADADDTQLEDIIEEFESTTVVGYNSTVKADRYNNLVIELL